MADKIFTPNETLFLDKQFKQNLTSHYHVLKEYKNSIDDVLKLGGDTPIFLDTSVILGFYEISFIAREKVEQFLDNYKSRIVLTGQIQYEFIKNREKVINTFQKDVSEQLPKDFNNNVVNKLKSFINSNKLKLEDYPHIGKNLESLHSMLSELLKEIQESVNDKKGTASSLLHDDSSLDVLAQVELLDSLDVSYVKTIKEHYHKLLPSYKTAPNESYNLTSFPGCAEKGDKDDPTGDFIIYHELMKYAIEKKKNIIFLTNDTTKGDWLRTDGRPHLHYLENFFLNTNRMLFIINAERLFESLFDRSFESLIDDKTLIPDVIDHQELELFLKDMDCLFDVKEPPEGACKILANELYQNDIYSISKLNQKLSLAKYAIPEILKFLPNITKTGAVKLVLDLLDKNYSRNRWSKSSEEKITQLKKHWENVSDFIELL
ncbi:hypothetical protein CKK33_00410 [Mucilaginibacter sp. MD40]|uniref:PIN-like domain-containing protein n=1 Tax=Mucilaginibacter sp. MD40 TaxID=2029590 RepID=UPI000BAC7831|nr:PIN-like domain-containing protein [Mucilaginibacter sp. MD40]PAW92037.1 hypothetical protein CKK33_00410 [Mucilaginibacter sp. MD40]